MSFMLPGVLTEGMAPFQHYSTKVLKLMGTYKYMYNKLYANNEL